jgi:hypothetical protein
MEMMKIIESGDLNLSSSLQDEINKLAELMENKRFVTPYGGGFIDLANYRAFCVYPAFSMFLKERLNFNLKNMDALIMKRYEELMTEH